MHSRTFFACTALMTASGLVAIALLPGQAAAQGTSADKKITVPDASVTLIDNVLVPAQEAGRLMRVLVKGGEIVEEGAILAEIDNRDTLAKEKVAKAELAVAETQAQSTAELEVAQKAVEVAKAEKETSQDIAKKNPGAVSASEIRKLIFQEERAMAQVKVATLEHHTAGLTTDVKRAQIEATQNELARRQITSPFKGEVNDVKRQVGEWVQPGDPIAHVVRLDRLRVRGIVYAKDAAPVDVLGKPVTITILAAGNREQTVRGKIDFASQVIDGTGEFRTFRIWAEVENERVVDPITKREAWKIQPGASAQMVIDMNPQIAARPPVKAEPAKIPTPQPATFRPRGALSADSSETKVESLKPVVSEPTKPRIR